MTVTSIKHLATYHFEYLTCNKDQIPENSTFYKQFGRNDWQLFIHRDNFLKQIKWKRIAWIIVKIYQNVSCKGGYVPGLILDPEEGIEAAIYAKNKAIDYSFKNDSLLDGGFTLPEGFQGDLALGDTEDVNGVKVFGGNSLNLATESIGW